MTGEVTPYFVISEKTVVTAAWSYKRDN
jgi:hypothetical protein